MIGRGREARRLCSHAGVRCRWLWCDSSPKTSVAVWRGTVTAVTADLTTDLLVGVADVAEIIGRPKRTLGEWRGRGRQRILPDSEIIADKRGTLIWRASHVLGVLAYFGQYDGPIPAQMRLPDLVSLGYIEELTGAERRTVHDWTRTVVKNGKLIREQTLPDPFVRVSGCPLWERSTICTWAAQRYVGRPVAATPLP